ncbi:MAG: CAP domain-containing protein [Myxococcota bacterium]
MAIAGPAAADPAGLLLRRVQKALRVAPDPSLDRVARALARAQGDRPLAPEQALRAEGLADPDPIVLGAAGALDPSIASVERAAKERFPAAGVTHVGAALAHGAAPGAEVVVLVGVRRLLEVGPLPKAPPAAGLVLRGTILRGSAPTALLRAPSGEVRALPVAAEARGLRLEIPFDEGPGGYALEILLRTDRGPEVAGVWSFAVDGDDRTAAEPLPAHDQQDRLLPAINALRAAHRRSPLRASAALEAVARARAVELCRTTVARHVGADGSTPEQRAKRAGFSGGFVAENLAAAPSLARAHENLLLSPSHRKNILDDRAGWIGIGTATSSAGACLAQIFGGA